MLIMMKSEMPERMLDEWRGIYKMQGDKAELCWEEDTRTCYPMLVDECVDKTTMELTSRETMDFQEFPVKLLEHYGMMNGNIEKGVEYIQYHMASNHM